MPWHVSNMLSTLLFHQGVYWCKSHSYLGSEKTGSELSQMRQKLRLPPSPANHLHSPTSLGTIPAHIRCHQSSPLADTNYMLPPFWRWLRECVSGCSQGKVPLLSVQLCSATVCETLTPLFLDFCLLHFVLSGVPPPFPPMSPVVFNCTILPSMVLFGAWSIIAELTRSESSHTIPGRQQHSSCSSVNLNPLKYDFGWDK